MEILPFVFILVIGVVVVAAIIAHQRAEKKRADDVREFADKIGLEHFQRGDPQLLQELAGFKLFTKGRGRTITNMIHGDAEGVDLAMFDYQYTVGGGKNSQTLRQTVVYIRASDLNAPAFAIGPENFFHRIGALMGMQDINFAENPKFSELFLLRGPNEEAIREYFNAERMSFFEKNPTLSVEAMGDQMAVFQNSHRPPVDQLQGFMERGFEVYAALREPGAA